jgi:hypothetical protein
MEQHQDTTHKPTPAITAAVKRGDAAKTQRMPEVEREAEKQREADRRRP